MTLKRVWLSRSAKLVSDWSCQLIVSGSISGVNLDKGGWHQRCVQRARLTMRQIWVWRTPNRTASFRIETPPYSTLTHKTGRPNYLLTRSICHPVPSDASPSRFPSHRSRARGRCADAIRARGTTQCDGPSTLEGAARHCFRCIIRKLRIGGVSATVA
jgi:hypothetical protein